MKSVFPLDFWSMNVRVTNHFFAFLLFVLSIPAWGQFTISGQVTDHKGEALLGVNVYLEGTYDGATTDLDGKFSFESYETGDLILIAAFIGYHDGTYPVSAKDQEITLKLREKISELNAVVITAGSFNASGGSKQEVLKPLDVVTTAGTTADIPGALNTLPGTQTVGETGRLFVRGGDGRETKTFIDGMLVHNEYGAAAPNTPSRSRFSPFMFKGTNFSTGGYSAEYGQALSSALVLDSKDLAENDRTDVSFMTVGTDISTTRSFEKSSIAGKLQYTNLGPYFSLVNQNLEWNKAPEQWDGNFAFRQQTSETGMFKVYTNLSKADMALVESDIANPEVSNDVKVTNDYAHVNTSYRDLISEKWGVRTGVSFTRSEDFAAINQQSREVDLVGFHGKLAFDYEHSDRISVLAGAEVIGRDLSQTLIDGESFVQEFNEQISAGFVEAEIFASSSLGFKVGLRGAHSNLNNDMHVGPRISAAYKTGENSQISLAYGQFQQSASRQILFGNQQALNEKAEHFIANYQWVKKGQSFRVELYEKRYNQLSRFDNVFDPTSFHFNGNGHARGLDLFWRDTKTIRNTDYWVSYSFLDTERFYREFPGSFVPTFASTHNFSWVVKTFISDLKSQIGWTYSFASSRTYNDPNEESFMSGRTPAYHDLSLNWSYLLNSQVIVHAMVNNALGINNIFGYEFAEEPDVNGVYASRPIRPAAPRFIFLGVFITLSKNKGINQLPNL